MNNDDFRNKLSNYFEEFKRTLASDNGDWVVKGFIDIYRNIYTISIDTKVVSKIIELMLFPIISRFASENKYKMILSEHQNHYPDITFIMPNNNKIALDLKSTYRTGPNTVNGFTLGAFTGYFRQRQSSKNITFPYEQYAAHFVLGVIYSRREEAIDERRIYSLDDLQDIISVVKDFSFLFQEKWRIAGEQPGSGNTKNIGSVRKIEELIEGRGPFASHGKDIFDDYWMSYLTADMARAIESNVPFRNLKEYFKWRNRFNKKKES
ncbi:MAG: EcoRV family type II restriction endonuclease [Deltaproteobacteria bacterium]|nr:EcoRV family type II restriction endonuclease [Deltaproteobacteria bacterium]MBI4795323.1 EcoRV family type II restriction endonuclease [Deltaproteobacteria bacterium]